MADKISMSQRALPKVASPQYISSQRYIPNNVTLKKRQKPSAFYDRCQTSAGPGKNIEGESTEANDRSLILWKWVCCVKFEGIKILQKAFETVAPMSEELKRTDSIVHFAKNQTCSRLIFFIFSLKAENW